MDFLYWAWEGYPVWAWAGFAVFILCMLALDLGVLNRNAHVVTYREAAAWSAVWVTLALIFAAFVFWREGRLTGVQFLTGYIIELSLSVDNLFVFLLIFGYFKVPAKYQHRVLFWGVLGALVMRMTMIALGAALIERFHWIIYVFGVFLVYTGIKMMRQDRKSTRLNSSHANISYAVFCLKANIRRVGDDACDLGIPRACQHPGPNRLRLDRAAGSGDDGVLLYGAPACPPLHAHRIEPFLL